MFYRKLAQSALLGLVACAAPCLADTINFTAILNGANQVPANASTATGMAYLSLTGDLLTVSVSFSGLTTPAAAGHIHCCATSTANAAVVVPFTAFPAMTSGTYINTFNLTTIAYPSGVSEALLIAGLSSGLAYVNIHDAMFPEGEIRGQVQTASTVPEPSSLMLLGTGVLGIAGAVRRRLSV